MPETNKVKIIFQPSGRRGEVEKGITIIEASRQIGVDIETLCGEKKVAMRGDEIYIGLEFSRRVGNYVGHGRHTAFLRKLLRGL